MIPIYNIYENCIHKYKWLSLKDVERIFNTVATDNNHPILEKFSKLQLTMFDIQSDTYLFT